MSNGNLSVPNDGCISDLTNWIAGDLHNALARLYSNNVVYSPTNTVSMYTEASFPSYAPQSITWGTPFINTLGQAEVDSNALAWTFGGGPGTFPTFGIYVTDPGLTKLLLVIPFLNPVIVQAAQPTVNGQIQLSAVSQF